MSNPNKIGIKQLKLRIKTSIPGKEEYIEFTSDLLNIKSKGKPFAKYPFFSDTYLYPKIKLQNLTYEQVVDFFFNKDTFLKTLRNKTRKNIQEEKDSEIIKTTNFELTLRLLFPTTFPLVDNIENSVEYVIPNTNKITLKIPDTFSILPRQVKSNFSYLNIGSETYTITKTIWNNDVMNHPIYSEILQTYKEFDIWKSDASLNINNTETEVKNMNDILSYVFDAVQKSDEDPLFKKMYDQSKSPYTENRRYDKHSDRQEFDNAIDEIMQKNEDSLMDDIKKYEDEYNILITDLSNGLYNITPVQLIPSVNNFMNSINEEKEKLSKNTDFDKVLIIFRNKLQSVIALETDKENIDKTKNILNEIIFNMEFLYNSKKNLIEFRKKKSTSTENYYIYFKKIKDDNVETKKNKIQKIKEEFLEKDQKFKLKLINLLGKLTSVKNENYYNISPDLMNVIDYLKLNVTKFIRSRRINTFIKDLNIQFLSDTKFKVELEKIQSSYVEFYNLALIIYELKERKIDNPIWRNAIFKMTNGTLEENYFNDNIWEPLQDCYHLLDEVNINSEETADTKKNKSVTKCNPDIINVGFDIIPSNKDTTKKTRKTNIPIIEIYLHMDLIEGKIDNTNMNKIKCVYDDIFLGNMLNDLINTKKIIDRFPSQPVFFSAKKILTNTSSSSEQPNNKKNISKKNTDTSIRKTKKNK
jgi:hypothetical protein